MPDGISNGILWKTFTIEVFRPEISWKVRNKGEADLTPADFFLWGLLKGKVYKNTPRTIEQLKDSMRQEIQAVNVDTLGKVFQNLKKRINLCLDVKGDQFQHRLWTGPVLHRFRYVYINFQVIISIT